VRENVEEDKSVGKRAADSMQVGSGWLGSIFGSNFMIFSTLSIRCVS
jgi:hypothetical protein